MRKWIQRKIILCEGTLSYHVSHLTAILSNDQQTMKNMNLPIFYWPTTPLSRNYLEFFLSQFY